MNQSFYAYYITFIVLPNKFPKLSKLKQFPFIIFTASVGMDQTGPGYGSVCYRCSDLWTEDLASKFKLYAVIHS